MIESDIQEHLREHMALNFIIMVGLKFFALKLLITVSIMCVYLSGHL